MTIIWKADENKELRTINTSQRQPRTTRTLVGTFDVFPSVCPKLPILSSAYRSLEHSCCCIYLLESNHWRRGWSLGGRPHPTRSPGVCSPTFYHIIHRKVITNRMATYMYILLFPATEMIRFQCIRSLQNCWTILFTFMREKDIG